MNCPTSCCRLSFSRLVRPMDQLLISGRRRALSIHWHLHFDFLLVARAAASHPLLSVLSSRPPSSNHVLPSLRLCYSTNRMMEVAALCSLPPLRPRRRLPLSPLSIFVQSPLIRPPLLRSLLRSLSHLHCTLGPCFVSWLLFVLPSFVPWERSLIVLPSLSPSLARLARPIVLSSIWDLLTCAYHQYVSAVRPSSPVSAMPLEPCYWGNHRRDRADLRSP